jgi:Protein of unknown function (DUF550)
MSHDEIELSHVNDCDRPQFNVAEFYERKRKWSLETFGPAQTTDGVVAHLRSEVRELYEAIHAGNTAGVREELADICLLAIDLSWRAGGSAADFRGTANFSCINPRDAADYIGRHLDSSMPPAALAAVVWDIAFRALGCDGAPIEAKLAKIKTRKIPDWRTVPADQPIEHVREVAISFGGCELRGEPERQFILAGAADAITTLGAQAAWSDTSAAMVIVERRLDGVHKTMRVVDLIAQWRALGDEVAKSKVAFAALQEQLTKEESYEALYSETANELDRVRAAVEPKDGEVLTTAAMRIWNERNELRTKCDSLASALMSRTESLDDVLAEVDRHGQRASQMALAIDTLKAERDDALRALELERADNLALRSDAAPAEERVSKERAEWRADSEGLRLERDDVRKLLAAMPNETVVMAAKRVTERYERSIETCSAMKQETDRQAEQIQKLTAERDRAQELATSIAAALGVDVTAPDATTALVIERANRLRTDAAAHGYLRRLVEVLGCPADFADADILELIKDRIEGPFTESEEDLEEQVRQLEDDVATLFAALHVATRAVQS